jgi:hypothetical protein
MEEAGKQKKIESSRSFDIPGRRIIRILRLDGID